MSERTRSHSALVLRNHLHLIAVGRLRQGPEASLFARYAARIRPALALTEIVEASGPPAVIKQREAAALLGALPPRGFIVALDEAGAAVDTQHLAMSVERWLGLARPLCFLIGGAEGLDRSVIERADYVLSMGPLTWPHLLARVMLAEQLFRARAIAQGHPYHRAGRP
jgi:23S rRNA (pseudouridine1915-N3)-methyltransferase